jgi:hypothetical protein
VIRDGDGPKPSFAIKVNQVGDGVFAIAKIGVNMQVSEDHDLMIGQKSRMWDQTSIMLESGLSQTPLELNRIILKHLAILVFHPLDEVASVKGVDRANVFAGECRALANLR